MKELTLGKSIIHFRNRRNMTQKDLAIKISMTQSYLSQIENGKKNPTIEKLNDIANGLDIPIHVLFIKSLTLCSIKKEHREVFIVLKPLIDSLVDSIVDGDGDTLVV